MICVINLPCEELERYHYKKVLLRERKRHIAHRVAIASACYSWGGTQSTPPGPGMGYPPTWTWDGVPPLPGPGMGYPPYLDLGWGTPLPGPGMGYPPTWTWDGVPPYLDLGWGTPLPRTEMGYPPLPRPEMGYPPLRCEQTETITFPHPLGGGR